MRKLIDCWCCRTGLCFVDICVCIAVCVQVAGFLVFAQSYSSIAPPPRLSWGGGAIELALSAIVFGIGKVPWVYEFVCRRANAVTGDVSCKTYTGTAQPVLARPPVGPGYTKWGKLYSVSGSVYTIALISAVRPLKTVTSSSHLHVLS